MYICQLLVLKYSALIESLGASLIAQWVKNLPAMQETQETWLQSLGQDDPLEEEMATHFCIIAWKIPWTEEGIIGTSIQEVITIEEIIYYSFQEMEVCHV